MNKRDMALLEEMENELSHGVPEVQPSHYWEVLNEKNIQQLEKDGYGNFKRTLSLNYFTWVGLDTFWQMWFLVTHLPLKKTLSVSLKVLSSPRHDKLSLLASLLYNTTTLLLSEYVFLTVDPMITGRLHEPSEGNPLRIRSNGTMVTQDLMNSILEYDSINRSVSIDKEVSSVAELGAGYGRFAYIFLKLHPDKKYIVIDIPPALFIAQKYLTDQFKEKSIFTFRPFSSYKEIEKEFRESQICFLLPHQLRLLPDQIFDMMITISSLHEMQPRQISYYFNEFDRLVKKYLYFKQWKRGYIPYDNLVIKEQDYPVKSDWKKIFWHGCRVQTAFFEALYRLG